ncbi:nuclear transport factor 2 family protein [Pannonibacter sp. SL95]|jgi:ketosteroid isomerase-like protein|uniref:nuclear transport factor 2 family protein n=1 Tax=Pannonibacter sp. SL95 TaxID=2995153 RepID=UPI0022766E93|nr:nuclear transport factor 2 family protein [Pannonibacter sp. SL95]MCY1708208.1 nuclear transport factor 2 family protein [Pannonibacter sp. SL95]
MADDRSHDPAGDEPTALEAGIAGLFEDYLAGFNDADADALIDCFCLPATIWQMDKGYVFDDEEDLAENIEALLEALDKEDISFSEFEVVSAHISGNTALVTLDWRQESADGENVFEFTCHYQLIFDGDDWRIAMIVNEQ